jgi:hypothetical protein
LQKSPTYSVVILREKQLSRLWNDIREAIQVCFEAEELEDITGDAMG